MARIHDVMAVHGVGEQRRGDTLTRFAEQFYKGVRQLVHEAGGNPNEVELYGDYHQNHMTVRYQDEVFHLWEISWERSFRPPSAGMVLDWLGLWSSQFLNRAWWQIKGHQSPPPGRGPWPRMLWLLALLLDLTIIVPLLVAGFWLWAASAQVRYQKAHDEQINPRILARHRFATGLGLTLATPIIIGLHTLARLAHLGAGLPLVGGMVNRIGQAIEDIVVGSLGDILLYVFDPVQSAFIRGELERAIAQAHAIARQEKRQPLIHIIGHSMGSVIAYEVVSRSLTDAQRANVKTLCTMGTVLDMVRYVLGGEGLVLAERVRFSQDLPPAEQGPRWLNLFARNDPATGFGPLLEFGDTPVNRPVCSTSKGHSTYWTDLNGVYRPFLAWAAAGNPVFDRPVPPPSRRCQTAITRDIGIIGGKLALLVLFVLGAALLGAWRWDVGPTEVSAELSRQLRASALPWPLSWVGAVLVWLLGSAIKLVISLPTWYVNWLLWLGVALAVWAVAALPALLRALLRRLEYRRRVPLDAGGRLNYWVGVLEGVGPLHELTLRKKGIWTVYDFMVQVARPGGRARMANLLGVSEEWVLARARQANLMRLRGVGPERARLLMNAGVDSLETLAQQERGTLLERMALQMAQADLPRPPSGQQVRHWVERAKTLKDVL